MVERQCDRWHVLQWSLGTCIKSVFMLLIRAVLGCCDVPCVLSVIVSERGVVLYDDASHRDPTQYTKSRYVFVAHDGVAVPHSAAARPRKHRLGGHGRATRLLISAPV